MSLAVISPLFGQNSYQQSVKKKQTDKCCTTAQSITPKEVKIMPLRIKKSQTGKQKRKKKPYTIEVLLLMSVTTVFVP